MELRTNGEIEYMMTFYHQMEIFSKLLALFEGKPPVTGGFP